MDSDFINYISALEELDDGLPHRNNLLTKLKGGRLSKEQENAAHNILPAYIELSKQLTVQDIQLETWLVQVVPEVDKYIEFLSRDENKRFSHQSDLISSVVPELLFCLFKIFVIKDKPGLIVDAQKNIIIDVEFLPSRQKLISLKRKRVDIAILLPTSLAINNQEITNFNLPIIAAEVKTNLDKNMISGIEHSVESYKKAFPLSKYFVISELSDFDYKKQNYASSSIDEIYILRTQQRSNYRKTKKLEKLNVDLLKEITNWAIQYTDDLEKEGQDLSARMKTGRLIKDTVYED